LPLKTPQIEEITADDMFAPGFGVVIVYKDGGLEVRVKGKIATGAERDGILTHIKRSPEFRAWFKKRSEIQTSAAESPPLIKARVDDVKTRVAETKPLSPKEQVLEYYAQLSDIFEEYRTIVLKVEFSNYTVEITQPQDFNNDMTQLEEYSFKVISPIKTKKLDLKNQSQLGMVSNFLGRLVSGEDQYEARRATANSPVTLVVVARKPQ